LILSASTCFIFLSHALFIPQWNSLFTVMILLGVDWFNLERVGAAVRLQANMPLVIEWEWL
jgi:hypothetical protein